MSAAIDRMKDVFLNNILKDKSVTTKKTIDFYFSL